MTDSSTARILLLSTSHSYRAGPFTEAAKRLGVELVIATDMPRQLAEYWDVELGLDFADLDRSIMKIAEYARKRPIKAIISVDDSGSLLAAKASEALGLQHNSLEAAEAARDKFIMRRLLSGAGLLVPRFGRFSTADDWNEVAAELSFPCVVKPLRLSGSRGVIRADDRKGLFAAIERVEKILGKLSTGPHWFLVEEFIPGKEVALEGILDDGLKILALFDKPDPLDGPFFEETIYVTPSRLPQEVQASIADTTSRAASVLGLRTGPIHAELRVNESGPWLVEIAGRSIGGLCSQTLRFGSDVSLEELIIRQACGLGTGSIKREGTAGGVMMIPIPEAGLFKGVHGIEEALSVPLIDTIEITAKLNYPLVPLPEGESYLGFIFATGQSPEAVESALRVAHGNLRIDITPMIPLLNSVDVL